MTGDISLEKNNRGELVVLIETGLDRRLFNLYSFLVRYRKNKSDINAVTARAADVNKIKNSNGRGFQCSTTHMSNVGDRLFEDNLDCS